MAPPTTRLGSLWSLPLSLVPLSLSQGPFNVLLATAKTGSVVGIPPENKKKPGRNEFLPSRECSIAGPCRP
uniref:Putative secreted peptide n=1 Tax=Anopheles braziliensis TaxID=58242 RepID=A0A2M3ZWP5_9DIPT